MSELYTVYWLFTDETKDPYKHGYIGVSVNPKRRLKEHFSNTRKCALTDAIKVYKDVIKMKVLHDNLTLEEALLLENDYRKEDFTGWNTVSGGGMPPSHKGKKKPKHSERMSGENNPFFGKKHTDEVKKVLSENKKGERHHFYGLKRTEHSSIMKKKRGKSYPRFRGYFLTPFGKHESFDEVIKLTNCSKATVYKMCHNNKKVINKMTLKRNTFIKDNYDESVLGKTYEDLGFGFIKNE